jgi:hypothetical protein
MNPKLIINFVLFIFISLNVKAQLKVFSGGNLTIGNTVTPASGFKLHLYGNSLFSDNSFTEVAGNSAAFIRGLGTYSISSTPDYTWWGDEGTGIFHPDAKFMGFSIYGSECMRLTDRENLLVGGTYDSDFRVKIDAANNKTAFGTFTNFTVNYGYAHISYVNNETTKNWVVSYDERDLFYVLGNGVVNASSYVTHSDSTLKENIHVLQNSKSKVLQLRGVIYNYKIFQNNQQDSVAVLSSIPPKTQIGLIAQEVELIVPEVVETNDKGLKGIAYSNIVALLIEAFKEQNLTIDSLKIQIAECCNIAESSFKASNNSTIVSVRPSTS